MSDMPVNLLPLKFRRKVAMMSIVRCWVRVSVVMLMLVVIAAGVALFQRNEQHASVARLTKLAEPIQSQMVSNDQLRSELISLRNRIAHLRRLAPSDDALQTIGALALATVNDDSTAIRIKSMAIQQAKLGTTANAGANAKSGSSAPMYALVSLVATDEVRLNEWLGFVRQHGRFREVRIGRSLQDPVTGALNVDIEAEVDVERELQL
jgi:hypothetical protein